MKFSYNAVWDHTVALLRAHFALAVAVAGVFIFLPNVLLGYFLPVPQGSSTDAQADLELLTNYWTETWYWQLLVLVASMVGILAILILVLDHTRPTVGSAISAATRLLPFYLLGSFLLGVALTFAMVLCLLPFSLLAAAGVKSLMFLGVLAAMVLLGYFTGRVAVYAPVVSLEHRMPLDAVRRTLELTRGHGWSIFALLFLILIAGGVASLAVSFVIGSLVKLILPDELANLLILLVSGVVSTALALVVILAMASIYRALSGSESTASLFD